VSEIYETQDSQCSNSIVKTRIGIWKTADAGLNSHGSDMVGLTIPIFKDHYLEMFCEREVADRVEWALVDLLSDVGWECR
jgi:hypothetical protein